MKGTSAEKAVRIRVHYASHKGLVREKNEDSMRIGDTVITDGQADSVTTGEIKLLSGNWLAIADGLGGHGSGEIASAVAVQALGQPSNRLYDEAGIRGVPGFVMNQLRRRAAAGDVSRSMGTTLSALCFTETALFLVHVGDSRIYSLPDFRRLTRDDTQVQALIEKGEIPEQMRNKHPLKNRLTRSLVADGNTPATLVKKIPAQYATEFSFLLCSDGLWENFADDEMREHLQRMNENGQSLADFAGWLLSTALERGGSDNISLIITEPVL
ncbi:MAG: serine/threonine-protein phosphatase [Leptonema illini]|uniref:Serine/threonine-protein phosphatase n=1 Tax=Leptonema illini TaxID=183 RepID=A0A833H0Y8_9LEPT|nr:MAG: serine/threonine-protein phosphatase [Leptonema illini]